MSAFKRRLQLLEKRAGTKKDKAGIYFVEINEGVVKVSQAGDSANVTTYTEKQYDQWLESVKGLGHVIFEDDVPKDDYTVFNTSWDKGGGEQKNRVSTMNQQKK